MPSNCTAARKKRVFLDTPGPPANDKSPMLSDRDGHQHARRQISTGWEHETMAKVVQGGATPNAACMGCIPCICMHARRAAEALKADCEITANSPPSAMQLSHCSNAIYACKRLGR
eukprot:356894-Chlamydomonas_euryale.AAC.7